MGRFTALFQEKRDLKDLRDLRDLGTLGTITLKFLIFFCHFFAIGKNLSRFDVIHSAMTSMGLTIIMIVFIIAAEEKVSAAVFK